MLAEEVPILKKPSARLQNVQEIENLEDQFLRNKSKNSVKLSNEITKKTDQLDLLLDLTSRRTGLLPKNTETKLLPHCAIQFSVKKLREKLARRLSVNLKKADKNRQMLYAE